MPCTTRHSAAGEASVVAVRLSVNTVFPAQSGSFGSGSLGTPSTSPSCQLVSIASSLTLPRARSTALRYDVRPPSGRGISASTSRFFTTHSFCSDSTSGIATRLGIGVTRLTQCDASRGVSTGSAAIPRCLSPASTAYPFIIWP